MDGVARRTVESLEIVGVKSIIVHLRVGIVALAAELKRLFATEIGRIGDIVLGWFSHMLIAPRVTTNTLYNCRRSISLDSQLVHRLCERLVVAVVALQTSRTLRSFWCRSGLSRSQPRNDEDRAKT
jgi:hypothetical protein